MSVKIENPRRSTALLVRCEGPGRWTAAIVLAGVACAALPALLRAQSPLGLRAPSAIDAPANAARSVTSNAFEAAPPAGTSTSVRGDRVGEGPSSIRRDSSVALSPRVREWTVSAPHAINSSPSSVSPVAPVPAASFDWRTSSAAVVAGDRASASAIRPAQALAPVDPKEPSEASRRDLARLVARTIDPEQTLDLIVDQPRILVLRGTPTRIYIAQDSVASYDVVSDTEVAVVGKAPGRTVLTLWMPDPENRNEVRVLSYLLRVREDAAQRARLEETYSELEREINRHFPDSRVQLSLISDQLVVRGQAKDVIEAGQIMRIVLQNAPPTRRGQVDAAKKSAAVRTGGPGQPSDPPRDSESSDVENLAAAADLQGEPQVVNLLQIPGEQQVMLRVTVAEVNRSALRSIGTNLNVTGGSGIGFQSAFPGGSLLQDATTGANALEGGTLSITRGDLRLTVNALKQHNLARTLAEPNLVTLHGRSARFQAGGQFPIPAAQVGFGAAAQGVEFVPIGVQLQFIPFIVDRDKIRLTMAANVSTRDEGQSAQVGGTSVPGINTRNFQNTVELREGQTLAVAGLIQQNFGATSSRVPWLGDLPVVGRLFKNDGTSADEQELVILITPELVRPLDGPPLPTTPGSDLFEPGDVEFFLKGRLESRRTDDYRSPVRTDLARQRRYRRCEDLFILGPHGYSSGPLFGE